MSADGTTPSLREILLAAGFTLLVAGIFLRGFARSARRSLALRREHELHVRKVGAPAADQDKAIRTTHLERNVGRYAAVCVIAGAVVIVAAIFRR